MQFIGSIRVILMLKRFSFFFLFHISGFRTSLSQALKIKEWRVANVQISELKNCQQANFILVGKNQSVDSIFILT